MKTKLICTLMGIACQLYSYSFDLDWVNGLEDGSTSGQIAVDQSGNVFISSYDQQSKIRLAKFNSSGVLLNSLEIDNASAAGFGSVFVEIDPNNNVVLTGTFNGTVDFSPSVASFELTGDNSLFLAKFDNSLSSLLFATQTEERTPTALDISNDGTIYIAYSYYSFGNQSKTFVSKINGNSGAEIWNFDLTVSSSNGNAIAITGLDVNDQNELFISGSISRGNSYPDFDPSINTFTNISGRVFIAKYDTDSNFLWAKGLDIGDYLPGVSYVTRTLIRYHNGKITVASNGPGDIDPSTGISTVSETRFIAQYNSSNGSLGWVKEIGDGTTGYSGSDFSDLEVDGETGQIYVSGRHQQSFIDFDISSSSGLFPISGGNLDGFVAEFDASGNFIQAFTIPNTNASWANSIALDANGVMYVGGNYEGIADFAPGSNIFELTASTTEPQLFLAKYSNIVTNVSDKSPLIVGVYPNPNSGQFAIQLNSEEDINVEVYNSTGQLVCSKQFVSNDIVSIELPTAGIYHLAVRTKEEVYTEKVVVQ